MAMHKTGNRTAPRDLPGGHAAVMMKFEFYRDGYRRMQQILVGMSVATAIAIAIAGGAILFQPAPKYFPTGPGCRMIAMQPLSEPIVADADVLDFAMKAIMALYTYDHLNWRSQFQQASKYFTPSGWKAFVAEYQRSSILDTVREKRLVVSGGIPEAPIIKDQKTVHGRYMWTISMPVLVTYEGASGVSHDSMVMDVDIVRVEESSVTSGPPLRIQDIRAQRVSSVN